MTGNRSLHILEDFMMKLPDALRTVIRSKGSSIGVVQRLLANLQERQWQGFTLVLVLSDAGMVSSAFALAYWIRFGLGLPFFRLEVSPDLGFYRTLVLALLPLWLLLFALMGLYRRMNLLGGTKEYSLLFRSSTIGFMMVIMAGFLEPGLIIARGWLLLAWFFTFLLPGSARFLLRRVIYALRRKGLFITPALVVGVNGEGALLAEQIRQWSSSGLDVVGLVSEDREWRQPEASTVPILGTLDDLGDLIERYRVGELVLATSALTRGQMLEIFKRFGVSNHLNVRMSSGLFEIITTGLEVNEVAYVPLVSVNTVRLTGADAIMKTLMDILIAGLCMLLLSPLLLIIVIAIKLDSKGPVVYRRRVMGVNGVQFDAFKFRTMVVDGDSILDRNPAHRKELETAFKLRDDPRITRVGRILRALSLDELPQMVNVLRREMSVVGPRMISPEEVANYEQWGINLLTMRPGITGLWQVSGRSDVSYEERVRLDMHYIRNWSIWLDLKLLLSTIPAVLSRRGAY